MAKKRRAKRAARRGPNSILAKSWLQWGGLAIVAVIAIAAILLVQLNVGTGASDFRLVAYQGQDVLGGDETDFSEVFRHGKPVVLNFWAGLCPPCRAEMPGFQRAFEELGDGYVMIGVDIGPFVGLGSNADARRFLSEFDIRYPAAFAIARDPVLDYGVWSMPTTVFLTPDGQVFDQTVGFLPEAQLRTKLNDLLDASSS